MYETMAIDSRTIIIKTENDKDLIEIIDFVTKRDKDKNIKSFLDFASSKRKFIENFKFNREECYAK
jgi:hypothetical protein